MDPRRNGRDMKKEVKGAILTILGGTCWGISGSVGQYLFNYEGMVSRWLVPIRLGLAGILILIYYFFKDRELMMKPWKTKRDILELIVYGLLGVSFCQLLYFLTIQLSSASIATILQEVSPIFVLMATCLIEKRRPKGFEIGAIILAILGIVLITTHGNLDSISVSFLAILAGVGSAFCVMIYNVVPRNLLKKYPVLLLQGWAFLLGGIFFSVVFQPWTISYVPSLSGILGILFVVIIGNILAFTLYLSGVRYVGANKGVLYGFAEPVTAAIISCAAFHTSFNFVDLIGFVCVFGMLVMISVRGKEEENEG